MEDENKTEKVDMDWTTRSWRPRLYHPYPWDWCEHWWDPRVGTDTQL